MKLTKELAALRADRSVATLDRALARGQITPTRIGKRVLFDPALGACGASTMIESTFQASSKRLLEGLATESEIAQELGTSTRTVQRLNLPFLKLGARRYYDIEKCRAAILARMQGIREAPKRGRPRRTA
jgi:hypothetical protein